MVRLTVTWTQHDEPFHVFYVYSHNIKNAIQPVLKKIKLHLYTSPLYKNGSEFKADLQLRVNKPPCDCNFVHTQCGTTRSYTPL